MNGTETATAEGVAAAAPATTEETRSQQLAGARRYLHVGFSSLLTVAGGVIGAWAADRYILLLESKGLIEETGPAIIFNYSSITALGMLMGFLLASTTFRHVVSVLPRIEQMPAEDKVAGILGVVLGLLVALLLNPLIGTLDKAVPVPVLTLLYIAVYLILVSLGVLFTISMKKELVGMFAGAGPSEEEHLPPGSERAAPKLLDTNVIIDGRILEIWQSGFVEGQLLVPQFVLDELQRIADSADDLKRARGRRGLDLLNRLKEEVDSFRVLRARDYATSVDDVQGVDGKLVRLASAMNATLLTNDFNLSRVAELHNIPILNVNRLALALKPVVMAGEDLTVNIIRPGRDPGQGVAYLDDGTMVVVEDGQHKVGRVVDVTVTSMLQTVAGKMIFAVLKDGDNGHGHRDSGPGNRGNGR